jgi:hypothetical protein
MWSVKSHMILFKNVTTNFLGNHKAENYCDMVADLLQSYKAMWCSMSFKVHFLHSHLDFFQENLWVVSDEYREWFHQDISTVEKQCQAKWSPSFVADYCWTLRSDIPHAKISRKEPIVTF